METSECGGGGNKHAIKATCLAAIFLSPFLQVGGEGVCPFAPPGSATDPLLKELHYASNVVIRFHFPFPLSLRGI